MRFQVYTLVNSYNPQPYLSYCNHCLHHCPCFNLFRYNDETLITRGKRGEIPSSRVVFQMSLSERLRRMPWSPLCSFTLTRVRVNNIHQETYLVIHHTSWYCNNMPPNAPARARPHLIPRASQVCLQFYICTFFQYALWIVHQLIVQGGVYQPLVIFVVISLFPIMCFIVELKFLGYFVPCYMCMFLMFSQDKNKEHLCGKFFLCFYDYFDDKQNDTPLIFFINYVL